MTEPEARAYLETKLGEEIARTVSASEAPASTRARTLAQLHRTRGQWARRTQASVRAQWSNAKTGKFEWRSVGQRAAQALAAQITNEVEAALGEALCWRWTSHWSVSIETYANVWWRDAPTRTKAERAWERIQSAAQRRRGRANGYLIGTLEEAGDAPEALWETLAGLPAWMHYDVVTRPNLWEAGRTRCMAEVAWEHGGWELGEGRSGPDAALRERIRAILARWRWREHKPPMTCVNAWALEGVMPENDNAWAGAVAMPVSEETTGSARIVVAAARESEAGLREAARTQIRRWATHVLRARAGTASEDAYEQLEAMNKGWREDTGEWKIGYDSGTMVWKVPYTTPERVIAGLTDRAQGERWQEIAAQAGAECARSQGMKWPVRPGRAKQGWTGKMHRSEPDAALGRAVRAAVESSTHNRPRQGTGDGRTSIYDSEEWAQ